MTDDTCVTALDSGLASLVRAMTRRVCVFRSLDRRYFEDGRCRARWRVHYGLMVTKASEIYARLGRPQSREDRDLASWLESIVESETTMARTPWHPISGLSNRGRWLETMLEEKLIRRAEARLAYAWISRNGWCNPCDPGHAHILKAFRNSEHAVMTAIRRIEIRLVPQTQGDLLLARRAVQCRLYRPRCLEVKYYPKVRARHLKAGIMTVRLPPKADDRRSFRFQVPEDSHRDGPGMRAARVSARRVNLP